MVDDPFTTSLWFPYLREDSQKNVCKNVGRGGKNGLILPTGQWYAPSAVINDAGYCMVLHGIHGIAWYCMVLHGIAWYCMVLHGFTRYCTILHYLAGSCTILHYPALTCTILHYLEISCDILRYLALSCAILRYLALSWTNLHSLALSCTILHIRYTCSQQMSPVIAFDVAVVAQKVKVGVI